MYKNSNFVFRKVPLGGLHTKMWVPGASVYVEKTSLGCGRKSPFSGALFSLLQSESAVLFCLCVRLFACVWFLASLSPRYFWWSYPRTIVTNIIIIIHFSLSLVYCCVPQLVRLCLAGKSTFSLSLSSFTSDRSSVNLRN